MQEKRKCNKATYFTWWCGPQKPLAMPSKSPDIQHRSLITFLGKMEFDRAWCTKKNSGAALHVRGGSGEETPFLGWRDSRHATASTPGHPQPADYLQDFWNSEGQECKVVLPPPPLPHTQIPAHIYEIEPFTAHSGQSFHHLRCLLCWCLWGSKMWKLPSGMHQIELARC